VTKLIKYTVPVLFSLLISDQKSSGQQAIIGKYRDYFGSRLEIKADSSFRYTWKFDLASRWTVGIWHEDNGLIEFKVVPILDTVHISVNYINEKRDSLVLSSDENSSSITLEESAINSLSGGGQLTQLGFSKLYAKRNKLFSIDENGRISRKRRQPIFSRKKRPSSFFRIKN
jgi:hypothetical protein